MQQSWMFLTKMLAIGLLLPPMLSGAAQDPLRVPAFTAYFQPDPDQGPRREKDGQLTGWTSPTQLQWFGSFCTSGALSVALELAAVAPSNAALRLSICLQGDAKPLHTFDFRVPKGTKAVELSIGRTTIATAGYYRFSLECTDAGTRELPALAALVLDGPAAVGAHFSSVERRNASSVHLGYPVPSSSKDEIEWFYIELTPKTDPLYSYYMATGCNRGYFGMQVNSATERRLIFSIWDSGNEAVDRAKVAEADRVKLVAKGEGVVASDFGHEGTGGHSHLKYMWKLGDTFRFLLRATPGAAAESTTTYTAWFYFPQAKAWGLIDEIRLPAD